MEAVSRDSHGRNSTYLALTESNDATFFVDRSNQTINFLKEAGDRFWEFDWIQGKNSDHFKIS